MLTTLQKRTAQAIVNIFETGKPLGDYGNVTVIPGDTGHLSYGRSQTTLASGNLALLLHSYCDEKGQYASDLMPYLRAFDRRDLKLDSNEKVKAILRKAGDDPVMKRVQDEFFDRIYWEPALKSATYLGANKALTVAVIYDSKIHGSYHFIRDITNQNYGTLQDIGEETWISNYISVRREWLANNNNPKLHPTIYRMDAFRKLINEDRWKLQLPIVVRNVVINEEIFSESYSPTVVVSAADPVERVLFLTRPYMKGEDVKRLQSVLGFSEKDIDGVFGPGTDAAVRKFQKEHGLKVDGKVGPATWEELGIG